LGVQKIAQRYRARLIIVRIKAYILLGRRYGLLRELDLLIRLLQLVPKLPHLYQQKLIGVLAGILGRLHLKLLLPDGVRAAPPITDRNRYGSENHAERTVLIQ